MDNALNNIPMIYLIIQFSKYLWTTYYEPGTVLTTGDKTVNVVVSYLMVKTEFWHNIKDNLDIIKKELTQKFLDFIKICSN